MMASQLLPALRKPDAESPAGAADAQAAVFARAPGTRVTEMLIILQEYSSPTALAGLTVASAEQIRSARSRLDRGSPSVARADSILSGPERAAETFNRSLFWRAQWSLFKIMVLFSPVNTGS